jgi:hypothetical protein
VKANADLTCKKTVMRIYWHAWYALLGLQKSLPQPLPRAALLPLMNGIEALPALCSQKYRNIRIIQIKTLSFFILLLNCVKNYSKLRNFIRTIYSLQKIENYHLC